eukprot:TRINITY_DN10472_c0_g4_i1.p1 TRINITY_DN10472_c0_g4~~TRINITY_DN10472_c0_g4_i1.p1  ORF type:complete len:273 (+),score=70.03 TRINITY_DN10472_c0_g4_i1:67-885(+)
MPIDYSKWDHIGSDSDDEPAAKPRLDPAEKKIIAEQAQRYARDKLGEEHMQGMAPGAKAAAVALRSFSALADAAQGRMDADVVARLMRAIVTHREWVPRNDETAGVLQLFCSGEGGTSITSAITDYSAERVEMLPTSPGRTGSGGECYFEGETFRRLRQWCAALEVERQLSAEDLVREFVVAATSAFFWRPSVLRESQSERLRAFEDGAVMVLTSPDHSVPVDQGVSVVSVPGPHTVEGLAREGKTVALSVGSGSEPLQWRRLPPSLVLLDS